MAGESIGRVNSRNEEFSFAVFFELRYRDCKYDDSDCENERQPIDDINQGIAWCHGRGVTV